MIAHPEKSRAPGGRGMRYVPAVLVIVLGVSVSVVLLAVLRGAEGREVRSALRLESEDRVWAIRKALARELLILEAAHALYSASVEVEPHEFREFVEHFLEGVSAADSLEWAPRVPAARRADFVARARQAVVEDFQITERNAEGDRVVASNRAEYFPVLYAQPLPENQSAIGFDLASDPPVGMAIKAALASGKVTTTPRVALETGKPGRSGVLFLHPVYAGGATPATMTVQRGRSDGVVVAVVRPEALFKRALAMLPEEELAIRVFDRTGGSDQMLYCSCPQAGHCPPPGTGAEAAPSDGLRYRKMLTVGERDWEVVVTALPNFVAARRTWMPWAGLAAGVVVTALAGAYLVNGTRHRVFVQRQADKLREANLELTREIAHRQKVEEQRRRLETQIQHAQKLESLGVLAGGIAHDFNNILMGVLGNADLGLLELSPVSPVRENLEEIRRAATRAADLCRQMLAYSGKGRFVVEPIDLSDVVREMAHMLGVSISKNVGLRYDFAENLPAVEADVTQIRQVVMNLITNASEAIGEASGMISVTTGASECDRARLGETYLAEDLAEGVYVTLEVSDTGCGMDAETKAKIFDPFFSTKFAGRGLGLAALLGIVRGHRGAVTVDSEVGRGTTFTVLLPACGLPAVGHRPGEAEGVSWRGSGTILLTDDEETVRTVGKRMLEAIGFEVLTANDGREAVEMYRKHTGRIDCVILDLTMPHMDGEAALHELRRIDPGARVLLSSGYDEQEVTARFCEAGMAGFIQKPYQLETLAAQLRQVLEKPG